MYDAVLFDMDGVLLRGRRTDRSVYRSAAERVLAEFDLPVTGDAVETLVDPESADAVRALAAELGVDPGALWARREAVADELATDSIGDGGRTPYEDAEAVRRLSGPVGVVSNNRHGTVRVVVEMLGLDAAVVRGRDPTLEGFERLKPDPYYLEAALAALDDALPAGDELDRSAVLYVGDRYSDVSAAVAAGVEAALLERPDADPGPPVDADPALRADDLAALVRQVEESTAGD